MEFTKIVVNGQEITNGTWEPDEQNEELLAEIEKWLKENLILQDKINNRYVSGGIKRIVEKMIGKNVSNVDIKRVMARMGIKGKQQEWELYHHQYSYPINTYFFLHFQNITGLMKYAPHLAERRTEKYNKLKEERNEIIRIFL